MNPNLMLLHPYPFERLKRLKAGIKPNTSQEHIDLSIGEPKHQPPEFAQIILNKGLNLLQPYPKTSGTETLKEQIQQWLIQRYQLNNIDPNKQILPVNGSREALFAIAQSQINAKPKPYVLIPNPFYQIYEGAALMAGAQPWYYPVNAANNFEPDWQEIPDNIWSNTQLIYTCSPGNPSGKVLSQNHLQQLIKLSDKHNFVIVSDECYSEIYPHNGSAPLGILEVCKNLGRDDYKNCLTFNSLSKRSNLPGLRSGFVAGDAQIMQNFLKYRTYHGNAMSLLSQAISTAVWADENHVIENRHAYDEKYKSVLSTLEPVLPLKRPDASFFIWLPIPADLKMNDEIFTQQLFAKQHITVLPGSYLSRTQPSHANIDGYVRIALVAPVADCTEAARRLNDFLQNPNQ